MVAALGALLLSACGGETFHVNGHITEAADSVLYFENMGLDGPAVIDSVRLDADGAFDFSEARPEAPEFYRLRIADRYIHVSIDSTETVTVEAAYPRMAYDYKVEGSQECLTIKELTLKNQDLFRRVMAIQQSPQLGITAMRDTVKGIIEAYKDDVKRNYIFKAPMKASAYFALFQTLGNQLIFNPRENKDDIKAFAAVATSWDTYHPEALRGQNLHNIALEGMKTVRIVENKRNMQIDLSQVDVTENALDIALLSNKGQLSKLSDLKGRVVLLDFHAFASEGSTQRIMKLREIYNRYHERGLEIYQVSLDPDEHFWKQQTAALPWVCVRDPQGIGSELISTFNIQDIPTFFTVARDGVLHKRDIQIADLDAELQSLL